MGLLETPAGQATLWGCAMSLFSSVVGQLITGGESDTGYSIDWVPVYRYLLFTLISTAPNFYWQDFLEKTFPQYIEPLRPKKTDEKEPAPPKFSKRNTLIKFVLDQSIGAILNTLAFTTYFNAMRQAMDPCPVFTSPFKAASYWVSPGAIDFGKVDTGEVWAQSLEQTWPIMKAGWKLWPAVSLINFTMLKTVKMRGIVGGLAGIVWGIYMSIVARG